MADLVIPRPRFTAADAERAFEEWGCNCGPGAIAAIMHMTLEEVRPHIPDFAARGYVSPGMMTAALKSIGRYWRKIDPAWPIYGLVRIQWEGPWTQPGVPIRARYRYTHWIGAAYIGEVQGIAPMWRRCVFEINCLTNGSGWCYLADWSDVVAPHLAAQHSRASGAWHITHAIEVELPQTMKERRP